MERKNRFTLRFTIFMIGLAVSSIGWSSLTDLVFDFRTIDFIRWGDNLPPIAVPTIVALILTGVGFILVSTSEVLWKE